MSADSRRTPGVLVLGGGGILGEAWLTGVLAGLDEADAFDSLACGGYVGTSAGSIVAALLVAGVRPAAALGRLPELPAVASPEPDGGSAGLREALGAAAALGGAAAAPFAALALGATATGGALLRRAALSRIPAGRYPLTDLGRRVQRAGARWDGRLRVAVVELESGRRVMLGAPLVPEVPVSVAVQASCVIPGVFRPVRAAGRTYVDGGAWSPTNMDTAEVRRGDRVLCLNPTGSLRPRIGAPAGAIGPVSRTLATAEALVLKRRGADVTTVNPDDATLEAMGDNLMDPRPRDAVIAAGLAQGRRLVARPARPAAT